MDSDSPVPTARRHPVIARFLEQTAHLGPEGQRRVLDTIVAANRAKRARLEAKAAIAKAKG